MTALPVQAVFFWKADTKATFKATYGRIPESTTYTKDFLQPRRDLARALERALGIAPGGQTRVTWRWPGGEYTDGLIKPAADFADQGGRMNLRWETDNAPPPWKLTPSPTDTSLSTLAGTPGIKNDAAADQQLDTLQQSGEHPWLVAVHRHGEGPILHARVVLQNPAPGREFASWDTLPDVVRAKMRALSTRDPGGFVDFRKGVPMRAEKLVKQIAEALEENPNVLLVGPPGTGKTVAMEDYRELFQAGQPEVLFDDEMLHGAFQEKRIAPEGNARVRSLVFHPSYTYEDFVIGLLPDVDAGSKSVIVKPHVGPLLELAQHASTEGNIALLECDEFNRGSAAAIFGDTLALLDRDKRSEPGKPGSGAQIATPYRHLGPEIDGAALDDTISLPKTLYILAAMNSADRSVAPLDAALRRRFSIIFVEPDLDALRENLGVPEDFTLAESDSWTTPEHIKALAVEILSRLNDRIEVVLGRDFLLGQSVFWHVDGDTGDEALRALAAAMDNQVMGTLGLSFTDNDAALAAVLNVADKDDESGGVAAAAWHRPRGLVGQVATSRLRLTRFQDLERDDLVAALASLL